ncbi:MAG: HIRAN domain-containing protein [Erysipelotrichaceae bacterium]|nr:HIRAN domain-containing protein [Erysipelotrichaceae bacterium]
MKNELTKTETNKIALMNQKELSDIIKPLNQEIHLFDTYIAGTLQLEDKEIISSLKIDERLVLKREETIYDSNTINIYAENGVKLGYIPEKDNVVFARLMDAGKCLIARVQKIKEKPSMNIISIGIYLVDF